MRSKTPWTLILAAAFVGLFAASANAEDKNVTQFTTLKCNMCHSIERFDVKATITKEEMLGPDLGKVGDEHDAAWIKGWLEGTEKKNDKTHKSKWKGTAEQLEEMSAWLATLKK